MSITLQEVKQAYISNYGEFYNKASFMNFDQAFESAWDSFNTVTNPNPTEDLTKHDFAQAMTECWQLAQH